MQQQSIAQFGSHGARGEEAEYDEQQFHANSLATSETNCKPPTHRRITLLQSVIQRALSARELRIRQRAPD
jgi:hypothetical protein